MITWLHDYLARQLAAHSQKSWEKDGIFFSKFSQNENIFVKMGDRYSLFWENLEKKIAFFSKFAMIFVSAYSTLHSKVIHWEKSREKFGKMLHFSLKFSHFFLKMGE